MKGFFNIVDTEREGQQRRKPSTKVYDCSTCGLDKGCITPKMRYRGRGKLKILAMAEAPGETEDQRGRPLIGRAGQLLRQVLAEFDLDLDEHFWVTNALICRPPKNRRPTEFEIKCCRKHWKVVIEKLQPDFIWLFGDVALEAFFSDKIERDNISVASWRRWCIPDKETGAWVVPLYHPSYVLRTDDRDGIMKTVFRKDIRWALSRKSLPPFKFRNYEKRMRIIKDADEVIAEMQKINDCILTFDYETSGLKPYADGHAIRTIGMKRRDFHYSVAFPFQWPNFWKQKEQEAIETYWKKILRDRSVQKVAQNIKFEHVWSMLVLKEAPQAWHFDTMQAAHIQDVRTKLSGLKAQIFLRFGIPPYDGYIKPFFKMNKFGFNTVHLADIDKVLHYQNQDAYYEDLLYTKLFPYIQSEERLRNLYHLYHEGTLTFADCEMWGFNVRDGYYDHAWDTIGKRVIKLTHELENSVEAKKFQKVTGEKLSLRSTKQLSKLFYKILKEEVVRTTGKQQAPSLDEKALAEFKSPFGKKLVRIRKYRNKWMNTYIKAFKDDTQHGRVHPFHNLNTTRTGRPSSDTPNFYNIPKRDKKAMELIRGGLIPSKGFEIVSGDYKQIEVSIQACNSLDEAMIEYCTNPDANMHLDEAVELFMLSKKEALPFRQDTKNAFVFPELYGDWYGSIAKEMWKRLRGKTTASGVDIFKHLRNKGIHRFEDFEKHVHKCEIRFWKKYDATSEWRDDQVESYKKRLYVESLSGWRRNGLIFRNEICNTPVQNAAFTCLLWSLIEINKLRKKEKWKTGIIGQIYDQIVFDMHPEEKKHVMKKAEDIMCNKIREQFPWIIVPLRVDFESSGIGNSWAVKEEE